LPAHHATKRCLRLAPGTAWSQSVSGKALAAGGFASTSADPPDARNLRKILSADFADRRRFQIRVSLSGKTARNCRRNHGFSGTLPCWRPLGTDSAQKRDAHPMRREDSPFHLRRHSEFPAALRPCVTALRISPRRPPDATPEWHRSRRQDVVPEYGRSVAGDAVPDFIRQKSTQRRKGAETRRSGRLDSVKWPATRKCPTESSAVVNLPDSSESCGSRVCRNGTTKGSKGTKRNSLDFSVDSWVRRESGKGEAGTGRRNSENPLDRGAIHDNGRSSWAITPGVMRPVHKSQVP